ncbi:hypothetical protein FRB90_012249 [Tulasnella sp. 427]|nr:hypothetical protein FRB90_012249 [Tulasnella sp. 427]
MKIEKLRQALMSGHVFMQLFTASGDLRNTVQTINGLPADYNGKCTLVINDFHPLVATRNVVLLCILLGTAETSEEAAAEVALHALYSSKLTTAQDELILSWVDKIKNTDDSQSATFSMGRLHFSSACSVEWAYPPVVEELLRSTEKVSYSSNKAEANRRRIMVAPERLDYRECCYTCLRPRHRVGFVHQRETGILLPLGQPTDSFCVANRLLYSEDGEWLLKDNACPASAWAPLEVEAMRQRLDLPDEDYIGNLFFYIKAQLTEFARRARRFNLVVVLSAVDMQVLPEVLGVMGMPDLRFDRVETSSAMDTLGPSPIISVWGPRLNRRNPHSALLMYSMNWLFQVWGGTAESQGRNKVSRTILNLGEYFDYIGVRLGLRPAKPLLFMSNLGVFFDTSTLFRRYLFQSGVPRASWSARVEERKVPRIMPSRIGVSIYDYDSPKIIITLEEFYLTGHIFFPTWHGRFVEFGLGRVSFLQVVSSLFIPSNILWAVLCLSVGYFLRGYIPLRLIL